MYKNGHVPIQEEALGRFRVQIKILWYPPTLSTYWLDLEVAHEIEGIKKLYKKSKIQHPCKFWDENNIFSKRYKDQNDRIGKIYRFKKWLDHLFLKNRLKSKDWVKNLVLSLPPFGQSALAHMILLHLRNVVGIDLSNSVVDGALFI